MKKLFFAVALFASTQASATCRVVWVDHDFNAFTPAVKKQVCDSQFDFKSFNNPGIRPIQQPRIKPIEPLTLPPIGTTSCTTQNVWDGSKWVVKRLCR